MDHPIEWQENGPDGQTGDHDAAPLSRTNHRAKTHLGYRLRQIGPDDYVWRTPHGLNRRVDPPAPIRSTKSSQIAWSNRPLSTASSTRC